MSDDAGNGNATDQAILEAEFRREFAAVLKRYASETKMLAQIDVNRAREACLFFMRRDAARTVDDLAGGNVADGPERHEALVAQCRRELRELAELTRTLPAPEGSPVVVRWGPHRGERLAFTATDCHVIGGWPAVRIWLPRQRRWTTHARKAKLIRLADAAEVERMLR